MNNALRTFFVLLACCCGSLAFGQEKALTVEGCGADEKAAVEDGLRRALEKIGGTGSLPKVETGTAGDWVTDYEILQRSTSQGEVRLTLKVWMRSDSEKKAIDSIQGEFGNQRVLLCVFLEPLEPKSDADRARIVAGEAARAKLDAMLRASLLGKGFQVISDDGMAERFKEIVILGGDSGLDESSASLEQVDYQVMVTLKVGCLPSARSGYVCYTFEADLEGYFASIGTQLNRIHLAGNEFSVLVRQNLCESVESLCVYFTHEAQLLAKTLSSRLWSQLREQIVSSRPQDVYELRFLMYSAGAQGEIYEILRSVPDLRLESWNISNLGVEPTAVARVRYQAPGQDPGAVLLEIVRQRLESSQSPDSDYAESLTPRHGCYRRGHVLVFRM